MPACPNVSMHLAVISAGFKPPSFSLRPSRAVVRPWEVSKSATTALTSGFVVGSALAAISSLPSAKLSFRSPHRPPGSAAETAIPDIVTLSRRSFHSSGVKFDLSAMDVTPLLMTLLTLSDLFVALRSSGSERRELGLQSVNTRLQHLGNAGNCKHLVAQLIDSRHQRIDHRGNSLSLFCRQLPDCAVSLVDLRRHLLQFGECGLR